MGSPAFLICSRRATALHQCRGDTPWSPGWRDGTESASLGKQSLRFAAAKHARVEFATRREDGSLVV